MNETRQHSQRLFYRGLFASLVLLLAGWWAGNAHTATLPGGRLLALGRLFGLLATYTILLQVLLMSRIPYFEENFDLQDMIDLHRWNGFGILLSISAHIVFIVLGYAAPGHTALWSQLWNLNTQYEDVLYATIGTVVFFGATALSVKVARKKLPYEVWFASHLMLYGAILLTMLHQLKTGGDFVGHFWFTAYWYMWFIGVFGLLAWYRFALPVLRALRYQFRVERVVREANDTYSVYVGGRGVQRFRFKPGQYATWWILAPGSWWKAHPFSFSSVPGKPFVRFTAKVSGDFTGTVSQIKPGTRVIIDGPRGSFTADRADESEHVLLIAGGIGVAPYLSTIGQMLAEGRTVTLLYAVRTRGDIAFTPELLALRDQGLRIEVFSQENGQRIDESVLAQYANAETTTYICGPDGMSRGLEKILHRLGVSKHAIITERFAY